MYSIGHRQAHKDMAALREEMAPGGVGAPVLTWFKDITDQLWAMAAVTSHPMSVEGRPRTISSIYGVFFKSMWDHNMKQPRFDILTVGMYDDNEEPVFCRHHPGSSSWGSLVNTTMLSAWFAPADMDVYAELIRTIDPTHGEFDGRVYRLGDRSYVGLHQNDIVSKRAANKFLQDQEAAWRALEHPRGNFARDLKAEGRFMWLNYLKGTKFGNDWSVAEFWLAWHCRDNVPCFWVMLADRQEFTILPDSVLENGAEHVVMT